MANRTARRSSASLTVPNAERIFAIRHALIGRVHGRGNLFALTGIDPWFLHNLRQLVEEETRYLERSRFHLVAARKEARLFRPPTRAPDRRHPSRKQHSQTRRKAADLLPTYRLVDTCAAEFEAYTPYYYSTYGDEDETRGGEKSARVMILGGGPNRIGQGIEFDYCCCHAAFALKEEGFETVMVNSNPETVSTDYDTSDKLYFEPLTLEDVLNIYEREKCWGVIVQFGGQTPLNLAAALQENGVNIIGTQPAEHRTGRGSETLRRACSKNSASSNRPTAPPPTRTRPSPSRNASVIRCWCGRPSCWAGGRWNSFTRTTTCAGTCARRSRSARSGRSSWTVSSKTPPKWTWIVSRDGETIVLGAIMEHIEQAGIHSGDSACVIPPFSLSEGVRATIAEATRSLGARVKGQRVDERAIRGQGRNGLRLGSQSRAPRARRRLSARPSACRWRNWPRR